MQGIALATSTVTDESRKIQEKMTRDDSIERIRLSLNKNRGMLTSMGVCNGLAGISLFHYYYFKYRGDDKFLNESVRVLEESIEGLSEDYKGNYLFRDIVEIGILLKFYLDEGLLDDISFYHENFDSLLFDFMNEHLLKNNINPVTGAINFGYYFLERTDLASFRNTIIHLIGGIESLAIPSSSDIYWVSNIQREGKYLIELGGLHGICGIVKFLLYAHQLGIQTDRVGNLITKALNFVLSCKIPDSNNFSFPFDTTQNSPSERLNMAYGDLGIAFVLHKAGKILDNGTFSETANEVLLKTASVRDDSHAFVKDANLLYGSAGLSSFYLMIKKETNIEISDQTIAYWNEKTLAFSRNDNDFAGYHSHFNQFDVNTPLSLLNGICGIGISLIAESLPVSDFNFMKYLGYKL